MPTAVIVYRLSVYFSLCLTVSSLYLPEMNLHSNVRRSRTDSVSTGRSRTADSLSGIRSRRDSLSSDTDLQLSHRTYRSAGADSSAWNKRASVYNVFSKSMTRHANRHRTDKAFVDTMFRLFDIDKDRVIERNEFKAVLQLLGIVSHKF